jgi:pyridoxal phosphate enzyme (YggS family)
VNSALVTLRGRLDGVRSRIANALESAGRAPDAVRLVAVVKRVPAELVTEIVALGVTDLGESRVQEAEASIESLGRRAARWHLIGHLQRNKAVRAAGLFDRIHSVDSIELARALSVRLAASGARLPALVEVNISGEPTKHGVAPEGARELVEAVAGLPGLALDGLMTVGERVEHPDLARRGFERLRRLRDAIAAATGLMLPELSMGMSGDFEAAIAEGSTMVRVGTALFGSG